MSGASIDGGTESDQFMSLPGMPAADYDDDDEALFSRSETSSGPSTRQDPANGEESYFEPF